MEVKVANRQRRLAPCALLSSNMQELKEALCTYRESLAELDSVRHSRQSVADSQEVCTARACCQHGAHSTILVSFTRLQVYIELQEAIALTQAALDDLQSTEAYERSQQGTTELAMLSPPASEASPAHLQASVVSVSHLPITSVGKVS